MAFSIRSSGQSRGESQMSGRLSGIAYGNVGDDEEEEVGGGWVGDMVRGPCGDLASVDDVDRGRLVANRFRGVVRCARMVATVPGRGGGGREGRGRREREPGRPRTRARFK